MRNRCEFVGHMGADPSIRQINNGDEVANFDLAVTEKWKDAQGQKQERTEWIKCVCFNPAIVKVIKNYCRKGSKVLFQGKLQTRKYNKDGVDKYIVEIVMQKFGGDFMLLDGTKQSSGGGGDYNPNSTDTGELDDEIPFITKYSVK